MGILRFMTTAVDFEKISQGLGGLWKLFGSIVDRWSFFGCLRSMQIFCKQSVYFGKDLEMRRVCLVTKKSALPVPMLSQVYK